MAETAAPQDRKRSHRESLLREGLNQFFQNGYHATRVDDLLAATGVPKGSFYHHFGTKEAFAVAVVQRYGSFHVHRLAAWSARRDLPTAEQLVGYFEELSRYFVESGFRNTDLTGKLGTEVATASPVLREHLADVMRDWRTQLEEILEAGQARGDVRRDRGTADLSAGVHALIIGAFVVAASTRDDGSLRAVAAAIRGHLAARPPESPA